MVLLLRAPSRVQPQQPWRRRLLLLHVFVILLVALVSVAGSVELHLPSSERLPVPGDSESLLEHWLRTLRFEIPLEKFKALGFDIQLSGACDNLGINAVSATHVGPGKVMMSASGLAITCGLNWSAKGDLIPIGSSGSVDAEVADSSIVGSLALLSDHANPPMPVAIVAAPADCHGSMVVTKLHFSGGIISLLLDALTSVIKKYIQDNLAPLMCDQIDTLISNNGTKMLTSVNAYLRKYLAQPSVSPVPPDVLPDPHGDLANFARNPLTRLLTALVEKVLGNQTSPNSMRALATHYLGPDGNISLTDLHILPVTKKLQIADLGSLRITLNSLSLSNLNSWSALAFEAPTSREIAGAVGLDKIGSSISVSLVVEPEEQPGPIHGGDLTEDFNFDLDLEGLGMSGGLFAALNTTYMHSLSVDQLAKTGCLLPGLALSPPIATASSYNLSLASVELTPTQEGSLEDGVDAMINLLANDVLRDYAATWQALLNHTLAVAARDALNTQLAEAVQHPGTCPPPESNFVNAGLSTNLFRAGMLLGALSLLALATIPCRQLASCIRSRWRKRRQHSVPLLGETTRHDNNNTNNTNDNNNNNHDHDHDHHNHNHNHSSINNARLESNPAFDSNATPAPAPGRPNAGVVAQSFPAVSEGSDGQALGATSPDDDSLRCARDLHLQVDPLFTPLWRHPRIHPIVRYSLPVMVVATILLFMSSNSGAGALVKAAISADGQSVADLPSVFTFSLISSIRDMWQGGVYPLAIVIAMFSGCWPYMKLLLMLGCWFAPTRSEKQVEWRGWVLDLLDMFGKWSLVDTYVLVIFMVAFRFDLSGEHAVSMIVSGIFKELGMDAQFTIYIEAALGFYTFLFATVVSLCLGHGMSASHRYALKILEFGVSKQGPKARLCNMPVEGVRQGKLYSYGPIAAVSVSLLLVLIGVWLETMEFRFEGLAGYVLGKEASSRDYSIWTLGVAIPSSAMEPNSLGVRTIQVAFLFFAGIALPVYLAILLCLWAAPLSNRKHREFFISCQVLNAWNGTDVFCVSILVSLLQLRQFAQFIIGGKCDGLNKILAHLPIAPDIPGAADCFDVRSILRPGLYLLAISSIIAFVTGLIVLRRCRDALCKGQRDDEASWQPSSPSAA